jgi:hypothetical protein
MLHADVARRIVVAAAVAALAAGAAGMGAQAPPPSASAAKAKELVGLLQSKKLETVAVRYPGEDGRFLAALLVPNAQLLVVAANYSRPSDIEYYLYHKEFMNAYTNLYSSALAEKRVFVEDALHDGLMALPGKSLAHDSVTSGGTRQVFDGDFADPRRRNQKKISQEDYFKAFASADAEYTKLLGILIEDLKKQTAALAATPGLR